MNTIATLFSGRGLMTRSTPAQVRVPNLHRRPSRLSPRSPGSRITIAVTLASLTGVALPLTISSSANAQVTQETAFLDAINAQRLAGRGCGPYGSFAAVPPVKIDGRLSVAARLHSADLAPRRVLSHLGGNGGTLAQRIAAQGYTGSASEVVANGFPNGTSLAQAMFSSPAACAVLMKASIRDVALGMVAPNITPYWTAILATPAEPTPTTVVSTVPPTTVTATSVATTVSPTTTPPLPTAPSATTPLPPPPTTSPTAPVTAPPPTSVTTTLPPATTAPSTTPPPATPPPPPVTTPPPTTPPTVPPLNDATATAYLAAINAQRAGVHTCGAHGTFGPVAPLRWDARLGASAAAHSADQASHGVMSHSGSDGSDMGTRIQRQGYFPFSTWGENVAYSYPNLASVMDGWMTSPGHCRNIMFGGFKDVGVAVAYSPAGLPYWTQDFAAQR